MNRDVFEELFILELANNHWGSLERGLRIIKEHAQIVRFNGVRAAIKMQFRDVDNFVHKDFIGREDIRYIKKTLDTQLKEQDFAIMAEAIRKAGCVVMSTPFDERSVDLCVRLGIQIIKIASYDINDWFLIEKIAETRKPVVVSTGGSSLKDIDDLVLFFENRNIPLAIMHCVSAYPAEDSELELNQVDFLKNRYPNHVVGLSTHEHSDWNSSVMISYAKGARVFERHVDIEDGKFKVTPYCSLPKHVDQWFRAYKKAKEMCGAPGTTKRAPQEKEIKYLDNLVRGVYAKRDLPKGHVLNHDSLMDDVYLAVPLQKGQISCRELMSGEMLMNDVKKDQAVRIDDIDSPYTANESLRQTIYQRGL